jgi:hypothetical protein
VHDVVRRHEMADVHSGHEDQPARRDDADAGKSTPDGGSSFADRLTDSMVFVLDKLRDAATAHDED